jgi:hypothetical protein
MVTMDIGFYITLALSSLQDHLYPNVPRQRNEVYK